MAYIGVSPSNGVRRVHTYTATASQTTFTGASNENMSLSYTDTNFIDVFQNGVLLGTADYTSTSGTSIVLAEAAAVNDIIVIVVYDAFSVADTVSKSSGGTFDGNVTMAGNLSVDGNLDVTGSLDMSDANLTNVGSIQLDSISGDADTNTSITFSGSDVITVATGGSTAFTVDASQDVNLSGSLTFADNEKAIFGAGSDLQIYHDGTNSIIHDNGTGNLQIQADDFKVTNSTGTENILFAAEDGVVRLFYNNATKLDTTSTGIQVYGTATMDGLTSQGNIEIDGSENGNVANIALTRTDASWSINNETNFRIYGGTGDTTSPSTKRMELATNGDISFYEDTGTTPKLFWDASAETLSIGQTSGNYQLHVQSTFAVGASGFNQHLSFTNDTIQSLVLGTGYTDLKLNALGGNVGIGDDAPDMTTVIAYSDSGTDFNANDFTGGLGIYNTDDTNNTSSAINFKGGSRHDVVRIGAVRTSNSTSTSSNSADFVVSTRHLASSLGERMRIDSSGNVGIGTSSPNRMLSLENGDLQIHETGSSDPLLQFSVGNTQASPTQSFSFRIDNSDSDKFQLINGTSGAIPLTVDTSGNVGIGTSSPTSYSNNQATLVIEDSISPAIGISDTGQGKDYYIVAFGSELSIRYADGGGSSTATNITELIKMDNSGAVTMPNQPAFLAKPTSNISNLTINVDTTVPFGTEIFDQNSDFASNTFTAPVTGKYQLSLQIRFNQLDVDGTFYEVKITTSNREYINIIDMRPADEDTPNYTSNFTILADMDASDTAYVRVKPYNSGASQADIEAANTYFSGFLAC